jgi:isocitrate dehydrogenase kinase/phosphatase
LPINYKNYEELQLHSKDTIDAIAFRFTKLQNLLGEKVFKLFLENTGFDTTQKSFLEILSELEKLDIIKREEWLKLREIRNKISHEYPDEIDEIIDNLNKMIKSINTFEKIYNKIKAKYEAIK